MAAESQEMIGEVQYPVAYRSVPGLPDYCVGDDGSVWSRLQSEKWRRMATKTRKDGRVCVDVRVDGHRVEYRVGTLVLLAFVGPRPVGMECCHWDGDPSNNHLYNLRWDTRKGNVADSIRHGTFFRGARPRSTKLTTEQVVKIRELSEAGMPFGSIAKIFSIDWTSVRDIVRRKTWKHVS